MLAATPRPRNRWPVGGFPQTVMCMKTPKYALIKEDLRREIESKKFENGQRFYSESELIERYGVSSITIVRALRELVNMGYLVRSQGKGTFVSRTRKRRLVELTDMEPWEGATNAETVRVVSMEPGDDPEVRKMMHLAPGEGYHKIVRVRSSGDVPVVLQRSYIPSRLVRGDLDPSEYVSVYSRVREDFNISLNDEQATEVDDVVFPAPPEAAEMLGYTEPTPVVREHKQTVLATGEVVEDALSYLRWDYFRLGFTSLDRGNTLRD